MQSEGPAQGWERGDNGRVWRLIRAALTGEVVHWLDGFVLFHEWRRSDIARTPYLDLFLSVVSKANLALKAVPGLNGAQLNHPEPVATHQWKLGDTLGRLPPSSLQTAAEIAAEAEAAFRQGDNNRGWELIQAACGPQAEALSLCRAIRTAGSSPPGHELARDLSGTIQVRQKALAGALAKVSMLTATRRGGVFFEVAAPVLGNWVRQLVWTRDCLELLSNEDALPHDRKRCGEGQFLVLVQEYQASIAAGEDPVPPGATLEAERQARLHEILARLCRSDLVIAVKEQVIAYFEGIGNRRDAFQVLEEPVIQTAVHDFAVRIETQHTPQSQLFIRFFQHLTLHVGARRTMLAAQPPLREDGDQPEALADRVLGLVEGLTGSRDHQIREMVEDLARPPDDLKRVRLEVNALSQNLRAVRSEPVPSAEQAVDHDKAVDAFVDEVWARYEYLRGSAGQKRLRRREVYIDRRLTTEAENLQHGQRAAAHEVTSATWIRPHPQVTLLRQLYAEPGLRVCVTGEAGTGKSALLGHLAWQLASQHRNDTGMRSLRIPIPVDLAAWGGYQAYQIDRAKRTLIDLACYGNPHLPRSVLEELCRKGEAVFLLDGLDEANGATGDESLAVWLDRQLRLDDARVCAAVLTSRPWAWQQAHGVLAHCEQLHLEEFDPGDIASYVRKYCGADRDRDRRVMHHLEACTELQHLVARPLLLNLLCFVAEHGRNLPKTEGQLLGEALEDLIERRREHIARVLGLRHVESEAVIGLLGTLAWAACSSRGGWLPRAVALTHLGDMLESHTLIHRELHDRAPGELLECLLVEIGVLVEQGRGEYRFVEKSYQEYLAGAHWAGQDDIAIVEMFGQHVWDPKWKRVIRFMVERLWHARPAMAARLVGWLIAEHEAKHDGRWGDLAREAGWLLSLTSKEQVGDFLDIERRLVPLLECAFCRTVDDGLLPNLPPLHGQVSFLIAKLRGHYSCEAACALGDIGDQRAVSPLIDAIRNYYAGDAGFGALFKIGGRLVGDSLVALLRDHGESAWTRASAVGTLGRLGDSRTFDAIIAALRDPTREVRWRAPDALCGLGNLRAVDPLVAVLHDEKDEIRSAAARALGFLRDHRALDALVAGLRDGDENVRMSSAIALGNLGDPRATKPLIEALQDRDAVTRHVAMALGQLGDPQAIDPLLALLGDYPWEVSSALSMFNDSRLADVVMTVLQDADGYRRCAAATCLGFLMDARAIDPLIAALCDEDATVRTASAESLGKLSDLRAVEPLLAALKDEDEDVREASAVVLGRLGDLRAVEPLIAVLRDKSLHVWSGASERALGELGDPRAVEPLIELIQSEDRLDVSGRVAMEALGQLGDVRATESLIGALRNGDDLVRRIAAKALADLGEPRGLQALAQDQQWSILSRLDGWVTLEGPSVVRREDKQLHEYTLPRT